MSYSFLFDVVFILSKFHSGILGTKWSSINFMRKVGKSRKGHELWVCLLSFPFPFPFPHDTESLVKVWISNVAVLSELTILKLHHIILKSSGGGYHIHIHSTGCLLFYVGHLFSDFLRKIILGVLLDCSDNNICAPPQSSLRGESTNLHSLYTQYFSCCHLADW